MIFEQDKSFKEYGISSKEADYVKNLKKGMSKRVAYSKAFDVENLESCSTLASRLENKKGEKLEAYRKHLTELLQNDITDLSEMMLFLHEMMTNEEVSHKDRIRCAEDLVKMMGGFIDRQEIDAKVEQIVFQGEDDIKD